MEIDHSLHTLTPVPKNIDDIFKPIFIRTDHDLTKRHIASQIDIDLGFHVHHIEEVLKARALALASESDFDQWGPLLHKGAQTWIGLDFQILQTNYHDIKVIFDVIRPRPCERIVDLGAGYGRLGVFLHHFYPQTQFLGVELVRERVNEGNRILSGLKSFNKKMQAMDLSTVVSLPEGDIFFIYDFGSNDHIQLILEKLKVTPKRLLVVKGRIAHQMMQKDGFYGEGLKVQKLEDVYLYS